MNNNLPEPVPGKFKVVDYPTPAHLGPRDLYITVEGPMTLEELIKVAKQVFPECNLNDVILKPYKGQSCVVRPQE
jgi:hypothetical protein